MLPFLATGRGDMAKAKSAYGHGKRISPVDVHVGVRVRRHQFNEEFREYVDQQVVSAEAKPLYGSHEAQT